MGCYINKDYHDEDDDNFDDLQLIDLIKYKTVRKEYIENKNKEKKQIIYEIYMNEIKTKHIL